MLRLAQIANEIGNYRRLLLAAKRKEMRKKSAVHFAFWPLMMRIGRIAKWKEKNCWTEKLILHILNTTNWWNAMQWKAIPYFALPSGHFQFHFQVLFSSFNHDQFHVPLYCNWWGLLLFAFSMQTPIVYLWFKVEQRTYLRFNPVHCSNSHVKK